jgi:hypothetical protein
MIRALSILLLSTTAALSGCATFVQPQTSSRGPASLGGLNESEAKACDEADGECKYFIAPCSMKEHSPLYRAPGSTGGQERYQSLKEEYYMDELEDLSHKGYCQLPVRALPAEQYNHDTCMYVFVKQDDCAQAN